MLSRGTLVNWGLAITIVLSSTVISAGPASADPGCVLDYINTCNVKKPPGGGGPGSGGSGGGDGGSDGKGGGGSGGGAGVPCPRPGVKELCSSYNPPGGPGGPGRPAPPTRIPESQFQTFNIPAPTIHAWPTDWAITGKPAAFWTTVNTRYINMTLLSYAVEVKVTPEKHSWDFGDNTGTTTTKKGTKPRPGARPQIGHTYQKSGKKNVSMTTTFSGEFSVDGGPWIPIDGYAHVESNTLPITVYRYHRYLVDDDCDTNPTGPDCH